MSTDRITRVLPSLAALIVGSASFALSFVALRDVSAASRAVPDYLAWLVPVVIDGGVIGGSAVIWANSRLVRKRQVFPFLFVAALVTMSVIVNVAHAGQSILGKTIAGLPPLVLLGTLELVAAQHRREIEPVTAVADEPSESVFGSGFEVQPRVAQKQKASPEPSRTAAPRRTQTPAKPSPRQASRTAKTAIPVEDMADSSALATNPASTSIENGALANQSVQSRSRSGSRKQLRVRAADPSAVTPGDLEVELEQIKAALADQQV